MKKLEGFFEKEELNWNFARVLDIYQHDLIKIQNMNLWRAYIGDYSNTCY